MVKLKGVDGKLVLEFSEKEAQELGLSEKEEYELLKAANGVTLARRADSEKEFLEKLEAMPFSSRVEGGIENVLPHDELMLLTKMAKRGTLKKYKGGEQYKKHIYVTPLEFEKLSRGEKIPMPQQKPPVVAQKKEEPLRQREAAPQEQKTELGAAAEKLASEGYAKTKDYGEVSLASSKFAQELREGKMLGMKGFTGDYYLVRRDVLEALKPKVLEALEKGERHIEELASELKSEAEKCEVLLAFLNEQGFVYEKRKGVYKKIQ
ncbi:MAG TPA: hypothetical protein VJA40_02220 [archaeon]|nr:hypothetical protein [archaeon]